MTRGASAGRSRDVGRLPTIDQPTVASRCWRRPVYCLRHRAGLDENSSA